MITGKRQTTFKPNFEMTAWKCMRLSAILLVPLVWIHAIMNTLLVSPENVNLDYVAMHWATFGWRIYDILLLTFAFSHGVNGLRQVLFDFTSDSRVQKMLSMLLFIFWLALSAVGAVSIFGGVRELP